MHEFAWFAWYLHIIHCWRKMIRFRGMEIILANIDSHVIYVNYHVHNYNKRICNDLPLWVNCYGLSQLFFMITRLIWHGKFVLLFLIRKDRRSYWINVLFQVKKRICIILACGWHYISWIPCWLGTYCCIWILLSTTANSQVFKSFECFFFHDEDLMIITKDVFNADFSHFQESVVTMLN